MGNVPTKIDQNGNVIDNSVSRPGYPHNEGGNISKTSSSSTTPSGNDGKFQGTARDKRSTSLVGSFLNSNIRSRMEYGQVDDTSFHKRRTTKDKEQIKENLAKNLLIRYDETVDGGFLAPYGAYSFEKLDYDVDVVKSLIVQRKIAPFHTPLQDFDESWSKEEVLGIVDGLPLHASFNENPEEFEDIPIGDLTKPNFDNLINRSITKKEYRRMHSKIFKARLHQKRIMWQENENESFLETKLEIKAGGVKNAYLPSDDLKYDLYSNGSECPICFLYFPSPLNYSKCCQQPICTECFVQIKRAEPHFPHEEVDPTKPVEDDSEKDPNLLTSEPSNCPYCATPEFTITFKAPIHRRTGIDGIPPSSFVAKPESDSTTSNDKPKNDKPKNDTYLTIISSDNIRPDWEIKLRKERMRLARRAANATAIHVSNQLIDPDHAASSSDPNTSTTRSSTVGTPTSSRTTNPGARCTQRQGQQMEDLENEMIQEAIRLSLQDEDDKKGMEKQKK